MLARAFKRSGCKTEIILHNKRSAILRDACCFMALLNCYFRALVSMAQFNLLVPFSFSTSGNIKKRFLFFLPVISILFLYSCKTVQPVVQHKALEERTKDELFGQLEKNQFQYKWFAAKISTTIKTPKGSNTVAIRIRMQKDSVIWISLSPALGIEVVRAYITRDSLIFLDRINEKYFKGDFNYVNQLINSNLDFEMLQAMLTGNNFTFYEIDKFETANDRDRYVLSTIGRRKLKKELKGQDSLNIILQDIFLSSQNWKIEEMKLKDLNSNRKLDAVYSNFISVGEQSFPSDVLFNFRAKDNIEAKLTYSKIEIGQQQTFPANIPSKYTEMKLSDYNLKTDEKKE